MYFNKSIGYEVLHYISITCDYLQIKPNVTKNNLSPNDVSDSKKIDSDSEVEEIRTTDEDEDYIEV